LNFISPLNFLNHLISHNVDFFTGVPDSLLKQFCLCIDDNVDQNQHIIAANEGNAVALASGYYLASGKIPLVYMQNSGLGNAINPLLSLCDTNVYSIPMLLLIGWRGEPGVKDEPQHIKQGEIQQELLNTLDIPYIIISNDSKELKDQIDKIINKAITDNRPVAIIIKKGTFDNYRSMVARENIGSISREESLEIILKNLPKDSIVVSTTGKTSREIFEIRNRLNQSHDHDFLTVGSMGHCSSIALGIALAQPEKNIICIDGDGSLIMHMGSLSTISKLKPKNYYHILINNQVHESVGGQETSAKYINFLKLVEANGYHTSLFVDSKKGLIRKMNDLIELDGPSFLEILVQPGSRDNLGRPDVEPSDNKVSFMKSLHKK